MNQILKPRQVVQTETTGLPCTVEQFLGGGGQGEVYRAELSGKIVALKWYFPASATPEQRAALETLVKKGPPNEKFLWPMELTSAEGVPGFGYIMPLRESRYKGIVDLMKRRIEPTVLSDPGRFRPIRTIDGLVTAAQARLKPVNGRVWAEPCQDTGVTARIVLALPRWKGTV